MKHYRYLSEEYGALALQTGLWKVGRFSELNDPLDCRPRFLPHKGTHFSNEDAINKAIDDRMGVICYSRKNRDPVIWSHYSDHHRGIALEFSFPRKIRILTVEYPATNKRPVIVVKMPGREPWDEVRKAYTVKARSWRYEKETRQFIHLKDCKPVGRHYYQSMPTEYLTAVIIGYRSSLTPGDIRRMSSGLSRSKPIRVFRAEASGTSFLLELINEGTV